MALTACKECGKEISSEANACPHCGMPARKNQIPTFAEELKKPVSAGNIVKALAMIAVGLWFLWIFWPSEKTEPDVATANSAIHADQPTTPAPTSADPPLEVAAVDLFNDYQANEVSADLKYKGRVLAVTGDVASINKDFSDAIWVGMKTSNEFMPIRVTEASQEQTVGLKKGDNITVTCVGAGMMMGSPILKCGQSKK